MAPDDECASGGDVLLHAGSVETDGAEKSRLNHQCVERSRAERNSICLALRSCQRRNPGIHAVSCPGSGHTEYSSKCNLSRLDRNSHDEELHTVFENGCDCADTHDAL